MDIRFNNLESLYWLWAVLGLAMLIILSFKARKRMLLRLATSNLVARLTRGTSLPRKRLRAILLLVALILTVFSLLALGPWLGLGFPYYIGWALAAGLLVYEHRIVSPTDLSRLNMAFFNVNGYIALIVFGFSFASVYV